MLPKTVANKIDLKLFQKGLGYFSIFLATSLVAWFAFLSFYRWGPAWQHDYPSYHLPFMGHDINISTWELWPCLIPTWEGYPPLAHILQGSIIRLTGMPALANTLNTFALILFTLTARVIDPRLPIAWLVIGLMAIPLFMMNFPTGGLDIFFCLAVLIQFMTLTAMLQGDKRQILPIFFVAAAGLVINSKMNGWGVTIVLCSVFVFQQLRQIRREPADVIMTLAALAIAIGFWPMRNWIVMGSPAWPFSVPLITEIGVPASSYFNPTVRPDMFATTPRFIRYFLSFFELTRFVTHEPMLWTFTMWHGGPKSPHQMMGGLNGALMASWVAYLGVLLWRRAVPKSAALLMAACVIIAAIQPQSHEMRYELYVPMILLYLILRYGRDIFQNYFYAALLIGLAVMITSHDAHASFLFTRRNQLLDAHPEIVKFWHAEETRRQNGEDVTAEPVCIPETDTQWQLTDPLGIYFTGPNLKNYRPKACRADCTEPWQDCSFEW